MTKRPATWPRRLWPKPWPETGNLQSGKPMWQPSQCRRIRVGMSSGWQAQPWLWSGDSSGAARLSADLSKRFSEDTQVAITGAMIQAAILLNQWRSRQGDRRAGGNCSIRAHGRRRYSGFSLRAGRGLSGCAPRRGGGRPVPKGSGSSRCHAELRGGRAGTLGPRPGLRADGRYRESACRLPGLFYSVEERRPGCCAALRQAKAEFATLR
jgi:hypothetical protein